MTIEVLIHAIVRQTTILIARHSSAAGADRRSGVSRFGTRARAPRREPQGERRHVRHGPAHLPAQDPALGRELHGARALAVGDRARVHPRAWARDAPRAA